MSVATDSAGQAAVQAALDVSRETLERLSAYVGLLERWQAKMNLVAGGSLADVWRRHILDSGQLVTLAPPAARRWVDLGSGAGFPGLVVAILQTDVPGFEMHLVESNARKCAFLQEAARITGAPAEVHHGRIEEIAPLKGEVVTARACAELAELLAFFERHRAPDGIALFLKGRNLAQELTRAKTEWTLQAETLPSRTGSGGQILRVKTARRHSDVRD
jgi:16S rRNA (guanine527-N7)-methyltransferase